MEVAEIKALAGLLDELDYYQLLEAGRDVFDLRAEAVPTTTSRAASTPT